ncbi:neuronal acetylcholine receptor subunit beta-2-like [Ylistrum balloti]|uniref:neuronal acetylcholine receptor subunit beta-2-like n=1 Tax=Ylistrum balloti TaxID=509963 RepID=UPI002905BCB8|nr:neuronal acetylcholine receptor subunit beta-2-like [Ylistrum balloti]
MVGNIQMHWNDELVTATFNKSHHIFQQLSFPSEFIWTPTISIFNSVDSMASTLGQGFHNVRIDMTSGDVTWAFGMVSRTGCAVDATNYPFDVQKCTLILTPMSYINTEIDFNMHESGFLTDEFVGSEEWNVTETEVSMRVVRRQAFLLFTISLARKPTFFMINMALPIFLLAILNTLVFLLPSNTGERVGYAIAAFLTFAVFLSLMSASLPQASFPMPLLSYYMLIMLLLSSTITFATVFNLRFHFEKRNLPVPKYLKTLVDITNCSRFGYFSGPKKDVEIGKMSVTNRESGTASSEDRTGDKSVNEYDGEMIGKALDKIFFMTYWIIYLCVSLVFYIKVQQVSN